MIKNSSDKYAVRTPLNKGSVVIAAVKLADAKGIESLSMRKLGQVLGVEGMALYHHFTNKEALIDSMVDTVHGEIEVPNDAQNWRIAMHHRSVSAVHALSRHPWAVNLMESRNNPGAASLQLIDSTVKCLKDAGFSIDMIAHIVSVIDAYTYGFSRQLRPSETVEESIQIGADILAQFPHDLYPYVGELIAEHFSKTAYRTMNEFEFGLNLILDGIAKLDSSSLAESRSGS